MANHNATLELVSGVRIPTDIPFATAPHELENLDTEKPYVLVTDRESGAVQWVSLERIERILPGDETDGMV